MLVERRFLARAWNCSAKSTAGSSKPVIAEKGMNSLAGAWLKLNPTSNPSSRHLEVPEAVLDDDGHLVGEALGRWRGMSTPAPPVLKVM
jgi:hypothetical protein